MSDWRVLLSLVAAFGAVAGWVAGFGPFPGDSMTGHSGAGWMLTIRRLTDTAALAVVVAAVTAGLLRSGRRIDAVIFCLSVVLVLLLNPLLKEVFQRSRPVALEGASEYGFPSGHAAGTAALVCALLLVLSSRRARVVAAVIGIGFLVVVGFTQIALGAHYPSDILAGWLLAAACVTAAGVVRRRIGAVG